jgi:hypothetical protein
MREQYGNFKSLPNIEKTPLIAFFIAIGIFIFSGFIFANVFDTSYISDVTNSSAMQRYGEQAAPHLAAFIYDNTISD